MFSMPRYISGWDVALLPFAKNESTRFISPTKTPEYLAAGRPVVSTSITDVVEPYGERKLVHIADGADAFVQAIESALTQDRSVLAALADAFLEGNSWDATFAEMAQLVVERTDHRARTNSGYRKADTVTRELGRVRMGDG